MALIVNPRTGDRIIFKEDLKTQEFSFSGNNYVCRRSFQTKKWTDRFKFCQAFLGSSLIKDKNTYSPYLERFVPQAISDFPDIRGVPSGHPFLYAVGVESIEGVGPTRKPTSPGDDNGPGRYFDKELYVRARVKFQYDSPTFSVRGNDETPKHVVRYKAIPSGIVMNPQDFSTSNFVEFRRYTTKITQPQTEVLRLPFGFFRYVEGFQKGDQVLAQPAQPVDIGSFVIHPTAEITYVWHQVPALYQPWEGLAVGPDIPSDQTEANQWKVTEPAQVGLSNPELIGAVYTHIGTVNADWFDGHPPGTLLLEAVEARPYRWITGERYYDYTYRMKFFNPMECHLEGGGAVALDSQGNLQFSRPPRPYSYIGHNYFIRYKQELNANKVQTICDPYYSLVTANGKSLESGARPVFQYRDFMDLFIPYNRAHMVQYYKKVVLTPQFE